MVQASIQNQVRIRFPEMHEKQEEFLTWTDQHPLAHCLVAPCGTKFGKSFACAVWLLSEAMMTPGSYCVWIAPTYLKCKIGYRYMKAMIPEIPFITPVDGLLEIRFANGSFIKFLHGQDAEVTVEGEAVDRFVLDESGKLTKQLWFSLFTTITQTQGYGILTGTPRGFNWFWEVFKKAQEGNSFFCWRQFRTQDSPYNTPEAIERAKQILPQALFDQYFMALFTSQATIFGDMGDVWQDPDQLNVRSGARLWLHPNQEERAVQVVHGVDWAKKRDYTVFFSTNIYGQLVGLYRFRGGSYTEQVNRLKKYTERFGEDQEIRYDATGVGEAVGDIMTAADIDAGIEPVYFTNKSKQEMVTKSTMAIETGFFRAPRIAVIEHEFASYEVKITRSGMHSYAGPIGEHDDVVSSGLLSLSGVYSSSMAEDAQAVIDSVMGNEDDDIARYIDVHGDNEDIDIEEDLRAIDHDDLDDLDEEA